MKLVRKAKRTVRRMIRFVPLFIQFVPHVWYAARFKHSTYVVHGSDVIENHEKVKTNVQKMVKKNSK